jgi:hypothetical protein
LSSNVLLGYRYRLAITTLSQLITRRFSSE